MSTFDTPILFLVFNRPDHTAKVFARIREVKPKYLFVAADGPRPTHPEDVDKCKNVRDLVTHGVDWECELRTLFRIENLGCGYAPASAISWFFEQVEEGIILEDDCLPDLSFFNFCETLLRYYRKEDRVMHIGGNNFQLKNSRKDASYYFSSYPHIWGWATWQKSWKTYDYTLTQYDESKITNSMKWYGFNQKEINHWSQIFAKQAKSSRVDAWDYQWTYAVFSSNGLSIVPQKNLVKNIGFGAGATHTLNEHELYNKVLLENIDQIIHPREFKINKRADRYVYDHYYDPRTLSFLKRIHSRVSRIYSQYLK